MLGDVVFYTGWTFEQVGKLTVPQLRVVLAALNRRKKEQIEMFGGKVEDKTEKKEMNMTSTIELRLKELKAKTGRTSFDLREVI